MSETSKPSTKPPAKRLGGATGKGWMPGKSGNAGGRPKAVLDVQALAREHTVAAVQTLVEALKDPRHKVAAAVAILDRGWGKATQPLASDAERPVAYVIRGPAPVSSVEEWLALHAPADAGPEVEINGTAETAEPTEPPLAPTSPASAQTPAESSVLSGAEWLAEFNRDYR
jgi:hypothetical protein